jgi:hypothetical protein
MKIKKTLLTFFLLGSIASAASAQSQLACIAIICLSGDGGSACTPALGAFYKIEKFTGGLGGKFSKKLTKKARKIFLSKCDAPNIQRSIDYAVSKHGDKRMPEQNPAQPLDIFCDTKNQRTKTSCK